MTRKIIPYGRHEVTEEDIEEVNKVLRSDFLTQGTKVDEFEAAFSEYTGAEYAVAVANGTAALHLSYLALDLKQGDKILTTPLTFSASANAAIYTGAEVCFADIDPKTFLLDLNKVESVLKMDAKIKCVTPVDFGGLPYQVDDLRFLAGKYEFSIIEDACHAPGASIQTNEGEFRPGDGTYSDLSIFSFHPVKHIAAGEGGMVTTNDEKLYRSLKELRTHGITKDPSKLKKSDPWYYDMLALGFNYRLTDIQSALGLSQLRRAEKGLERRRKIAKKYLRELNGLPISSQHIPANASHAYHLFIITTEKRDTLFQFLREKNIYPQVHYIPVHTLTYYQKLGWKKGDFPNAERYYDECLSLPMYPALSDDDQDFIIEQLQIFFNK